jgi:ABC-type multidrug transport system ATPase subunit/ABC-type multidrug transport system permease subunit
VAQGGAKLGLFVFCLAQIAFANFPESTYVVEWKFVAFKQVRAGMYPAWAYTAAATALQVPLAAAESAAFSLILYFMADLARDGGRWAFFFLIVLCVNLAVGSLFRLLAYVVPTPEAALAAPGPFVALQLVFAGFLIPPAQMGTSGWLVFIYYTSTFAYGARSLAHNEFGSKAYAVFPATNATVAAATLGGTRILEQGAPASAAAMFFPAATCAATPALGCGRESYGALTMRALGIQAAPPWKWGGVGFLLFFALLMNALAARVVAKKAAEADARSAGSTCVADSSESGDVSVSVAADAQKSGDGVAPAGAEANADAAADARALSFTRITVAWRDVRYSVDTPAGRKTLLHGVSGVAAPGRLLALMGASGAGKTTLLDVIACRKPAGDTEGSISLNGFAPERTAFARLTAYCEQMDVHTPLATVAEALHFSAALRLPAGVSPAARAAFVAEVIELLELSPLASRLVGEAGAPDALSPSQRKLLTVAVELVSNAPILFLDEPTSGLDSRAAALVMRVVRRVASTGRTVVSTVHQPSAEVFAVFDDILLLQRGGWMAYFGAVVPIDGGDCTGAIGLVQYLQALPGAPAYPEGMNAASWMLDVLACTDSSGGGGGGSDAALPAAAASCSSSGAMAGEALQTRLHASPHWAGACTSALDAACAPAPGAVAFAFDALYARPFSAQLRAVLARTARSYARSLGYVHARIKILFVLNLLFGAVWYKKQQAVDCAPKAHADRFLCENTPAGVQAIVGIIFINALFVSVVCTTSLLPYMFRARAVLYRERAAFMYAPEAHALAHLLVEMPWLLLTVHLVITPLYFMVGFTASAPAYWFYLLVIWLTVMCFVSVGQWCAAHFSSAALAQAVVSLLLPLMALFAGVYLPKAQLPNGDENGHPHVYWLWFFYIDPVSHAVEALAPARFWDPARPTTVQHAIKVPRGAGFVDVDALTYVETTRGSRYEDRWNQVGYLVAIAGGLQVLHVYATRRYVHAAR